jgi:hypothetical protein
MSIALWPGIAGNCQNGRKSMLICLSENPNNAQPHKGITGFSGPPSTEGPKYFPNGEGTAGTAGGLKALSTAQVLGGWPFTDQLPPSEEGGAAWERGDVVQGQRLLEAALLDDIGGIGARWQLPIEAQSHHPA